MCKAGSVYNVFIVTGCAEYYLTHQHTHVHTDICKYMHVRCTVQKKALNCKIKRLFDLSQF